ncbi:MAG: WD40 repeat domain-containing protein [Gemmataceae bacterium]
MHASTLSLALALTAPVTPPDDGQKALVIPAQEHAGGNAQAVALSADGKYVAAGFGGPSNGRFPLKPNGGGVFVWERTTGKQVFARGEYGDILQIGFSHDGRFLVYSRIYTPGDSVDDDTTVVIDLESKETVQRWRKAGFALSPTSDVMVVASGRDTEIFNLKTRKVERSVAVRSARAFSFAADGKTAAALCYYFEGNRGTPTGLAVFKIDEEKPILYLRDESLRTAQAVTIAPDSKRVVTGHTEGQARLWTVDNKVEPFKIEVDTKLSVFPFFAREGKTLVLATQPANGISWTYDRTDPSGFKFAKGKTPPASDLYFFDFPALKRQQHWRFEDGSYRTNYARFGSSRNSPEYNPVRFAVSTDAKVLAAGCNGCSLVDLNTGKLMRTFQPKP